MEGGICIHSTLAIMDDDAFTTVSANPILRSTVMDSGLNVLSKERSAKLVGEILPFWVIR
jgi:hypothetical protein